MVRTPLAVGTRLVPEAIVAGVGIALGLIGLLHSAWPARANLSSLISDLEGAGDRVAGVARGSSADMPTGTVRGGLRYEMGSYTAAVLAARGWDRWVPAADLAIVQQTLAQLCAQAFGSMFMLGCLPVALWAASAALGAALPPVAAMWGVLLCSVVGFSLPLLGLRSRARGRRDHLRRAVSAFLGMVVLAQAGGMGIDGALSTAASVSADWAFAWMKRTLDSARDLRVAPWDALGAMGADLGVTELAEISMHIALAGREGARVRESLAAKSASLRRHETARLEARANAVTERMFLPGVILMAGFLVFIGYPAFESVLKVT